ncbi:DEAD/DEAH box helicase [Geosmithia morbida]|uniref:DEAD/DEAH box helicase n=1 Tax=Geosmithia morbida TaxID=1094350 RepID=A0A9P4Z042_9HYPO|nr:DEAD/DEAH box helicase [Geosmithia morbida]KAF4124199.1 DEAD/DEAH box helicase [Geosmithia morbida]
MPRPKRTRQAAAKSAAAAAAAPAANNVEEPETSRGRTRTSTRSMRTRRSSGAAEGQADNNIENDASEAAPTPAVAPDNINNNNSSSSSSSSDAVETGRRVTTPQRRDTSGLDLGDDDMFGDLDESFDKEAGGIGNLIPSSGGSRRFGDNSSVFGGGSSHTKPRSRSRQSSIIRPTSRGGNTPLMSSSLNLGAFRRRAREPSILGTARKAFPDISHVTHNTTSADQEPHEAESDDDDDESVPEAESTPINNRRATRSSLRQQEQEQEQEQELSGSRKRKSDGNDGGSSRPDKVTRTILGGQDENADASADAADNGDSDSELSSLPSSPSSLPRFTMAERPVTPSNDSHQDFAAPPASSDVDGDDMDWWPDIHGLARKRRRPSVAEPLAGPSGNAADDDGGDVASNVSSPPSLTHSPNLHARGGGRIGGASKSHARARRVPSPPPLTTADLANLLPKRRHIRERHHHAQDDQAEYDTAGIAHDQDELSFVGADTRRRATTRHNTAAATAAAAAAAGKKKEKQAGGRPGTRSSSRHTQTYSRRSSDKENDDDDDDQEGEESMFQPLADETFDGDTASDEARRNALLSDEELKTAAIKFKEVDRWELSFEEASEAEEVLGAEAR